MKDLLILGTGVHGGEIAEIVERINLVENKWNILGFITADSARVGDSFNGYPVLGMKEELENYCDAFFIPEYEWPYKEEMIADQRIISIADPSAFISRTASIGPGSVIYPNCFIGLNAKLGKFVFCLSGSIINHDNVIEDFATITSGVSLAGSVHVEAGCYMGQACTVRQHIRIGRKSIIGMGSTVIRDVPPNSIIAGNPAKEIKMKHV